TLSQSRFPDDRGSRRHISIVDYISESQILKIAVRVRSSGFKQSLLHLPVDAPIEITIPHNDIKLPKDNTIPLVFIAGGIGITPFISMFTYLQRHKLKTSITLLYSNRSVVSTPYFDEIQTFTKQVPTIT